MDRAELRAGDERPSCSSPPSAVPSLPPQDQPMSADQRDRLSERVEEWLMDWLERRAGVERDQIHPDKPFAEYGLDSLTAVEMSQDIEDWLGVQVTATVAWNYPTSSAMARYLALEVAGTSEREVNGSESDAVESISDFEKMLAEVENLSDEEAERLLADQGDSVVE